jgi:nitrous oxidase accessory protein NosD
MKSVRRFTLWSALVLVVTLAAAAQAVAGPSPTDGPTSTSTLTGPIYITAPFAPGEVDLSSLGVSPTELLTVGPIPSSSTPPGNLIVDNDGLDCPNAQFTTIQSAVDAAAPGDMIKVCRGVYMEQVMIPAGKNGLTLFSAPDLQAVIKAPPLMADPKAIVRVSGAKNVTIRHFTITGPGDGGCDSIRYGVRVDNGGSALITDNHITEIRDLLSIGGALSGCQNGIAVDIGRVFDNGVGTGTVVHNLIDKYQKGGVLVSNAGSVGEVAYNEVIGTPSETIAQNGVQVSASATGNVHHNKISQNQYLPEGTEATGVLLFLDPNARAHHNYVFLNEDGIGIFQVTNSGATVSYNNSRQNTARGIIVYDQSMDNLISYNRATDNMVLDCVDNSTGGHTGGVANRWVKDLGQTENKPGLCKQAPPQ